MRTSRAEGFSDGVLAVILTIMVLEMKSPAGAHLSSLRPLAPVFLSYVLSFFYIGIYWANHHHLFFAVERVNGAVLWANLHLLFWASLVPFTTAWMGENHFAAWPVALYGLVLLLVAAAYFLLVRILVRLHGRESLLARSMGSDWKTIVSMLIYAASIPLAFVWTWASLAGYAVVAGIWFVPDRRIERRIEPRSESGPE